MLKQSSILAPQWLHFKIIFENLVKATLKPNRKTEASKENAAFAFKQQNIAGSNQIDVAFVFCTGSHWLSATKMTAFWLNNTTGW